MLPWGPPDIKLSVGPQKSPFGDIENFTKLAHDPIQPYHGGSLIAVSSAKTSTLVTNEVPRCGVCHVGFSVHNELFMMPTAKGRQYHFAGHVMGCKIHAHGDN